MRVFLALCSLVVLAHGKPQGYSYSNGISGGYAGGAPAASTPNNQYLAPPRPAGFSAPSAGSIGFGGLSGGNQGFSGFQSSGNVGGNAGGFNAFAGFQGASSNVQQYQQQHQQSAATFEAPLVHKQFITVSAPEDNDTLEKTKHLVIGRPQKNYRVVFIKAPSSSNANVKLSAEYAPQEEKTVIYVLSKKDSSLDVNEIATPAPSVPAKPEVFFIKYKTDEEAHHAQKQIQAEYDKIEGSSEHTDAGVAPVQSVIGILGNQNGNTGSSVGAAGSSSGAATSSGFVGSASTQFGSAVNQLSATPSKYLPPSH